MSLGALTTPFTPAPSCLISTAPSSTNLWSASRSFDQDIPCTQDALSGGTVLTLYSLVTDNVWQVQTSIPGTDQSPIYELMGPPLTSDCFPSNYNPASTAFYSPGICPSGYSAATSSTLTIGTLTETKHVCCPTAMSFKPQTTDIVRTQHVFLSTLLCEALYSGTSTFTITKTLLDVPTPITTIMSFARGAVNAYGVVVKFQKGDFDSKTPTPSPGSSGQTSGTSQTTNASNTSGASNAGVTSGGGGGGGLSTGAGIGIGVGVGVIGVALIIGGVFLFLRSRKRKEAAKHEFGTEGYHTYSVPEHTAPPQELETTTFKHEAPPQADPVELDSRNRR